MWHKLLPKMKNEILKMQQITLLLCVFFCPSDIPMCPP